MGVEEIQKAVRKLPAGKRRKLTTWMVREFPALTVESLIDKQARKLKTGAEPPKAPTAGNVPTGATLKQVKRTVKRLGLAR